MPIAKYSINNKGSNLKPTKKEKPVANSIKRILIHKRCLPNPVKSTSKEAKFNPIIQFPE